MDPTTATTEEDNSPQINSAKCKGLFEGQLINGEINEQIAQIGFAGNVKEVQAQIAQLHEQQKSVGEKIEALEKVEKRSKKDETELKSLRTQRTKLEADLSAGDVGKLTAILRLRQQKMKVSKDIRHTLAGSCTLLANEMLTLAAQDTLSKLAGAKTGKKITVETMRAMDYSGLKFHSLLRPIPVRPYLAPKTKKKVVAGAETPAVEVPAPVVEAEPESIFTRNNGLFVHHVDKLWNLLKSSNADFGVLKLSAPAKHYVSDMLVALHQRLYVLTRNLVQYSGVKLIKRDAIYAVIRGILADAGDDVEGFNVYMDAFLESTPQLQKKEKKPAA